MEVSPHFLLSLICVSFSFFCVSCMFLLIPYLECWFARRLSPSSSLVATQWSHAIAICLEAPAAPTAICTAAFVGEIKFLGQNFASLVDCVLNFVHYIYSR